MVIDHIGWVTASQQQLTMQGEIEPLHRHEDTSPTTVSVHQIMHNLCRQLLPDTSRPVTYSTEDMIAMLTSHLAHYPHMIVVDNLETVTDYHTLLPVLQRLTIFAHVTRAVTWFGYNL
ncbi:MAG: hypothetical protein AAF639_38910 [Chloroflexota bacterium]